MHWLLATGGNKRAQKTTFADDWKKQCDCAVSCFIDFIVVPASSIPMWLRQLWTVDAFVLRRTVDEESILDSTSGGGARAAQLGSRVPVRITSGLIQSQ